jgi:hypothetical protein
VSLRAYAKRRGVSANAVSRAVRTGRLRASVVQTDDGPKIVDVELADREWAANTDLSRAPDAVKASGVASSSSAELPVDITDAADTATPTFLEPQAHGGALKRTVAVPPDFNPTEASIAQASAREKHWRAKKAELDYRRAAGELVEAAEIAASVAEAFTTVRTKVLGLPAKAKQQLPHLSHQDLAALDAMVRETLEGLAAEGAA